MFSRSRLLIDLDLIKGSLNKFFLLPKSEFNNYIALLSDGTKILNIMDACKTVVSIRWIKSPARIPSYTSLILLLPTLWLSCFVVAKTHVADEGKCN